MRDQTYFVRLDPLDPDGDRVRARIVTDRGTLVFFAVQYEALIADRHQAVARYDMSHGVAHRDLLDRDGHNADKKWFPELTIEQALQWACEDFKANWRRFRAEFIRREGFPS